MKSEGAMRFVASARGLEQSNKAGHNQPPLVERKFIPTLENGQNATRLRKLSREIRELQRDVMMNPVVLDRVFECLERNADLEGIEHLNVNERERFVRFLALLRELLPLGNEVMVARLAAEGAVSKRVASAMVKVPRHMFVNGLMKLDAHEDRPLGIGNYQTISAPNVVAVVTDYLDIRKGMVVLEIGSGSGWHAAIMAELLGKRGKVVTVERIPELVELAKANIERIGYRNIEILSGDGSAGVEGHFDRILVPACFPEVPYHLAEQLKEGGKLVASVGTMDEQELIMLERNGGIVKTTLRDDMGFVALVGLWGYPDVWKVLTL